MAFTSCDDKLPDATPQSNPQQTVLDVDGLTATAILSENSPVTDLNQLADTAYVNLLSFGTKDGVTLPDNTTVAAVAEFASDENYNDVKTIELGQTTVAAIKAADDYTFGVKASDLDKIYKSIITKNPTVAKPMYVRYSVLLTKGDQTTYAGGKKYPISGLFPSFTGKTYLPYNIEDTYYVLVSSSNGVDVSEAYQPTAGDQYDHPEFKAKLDIPAGGAKCLILPKSSYVKYQATGAVPTDAEYMSFGGSLADSVVVANKAGEVADAIEYGEVGAKFITFNMETLRFEFSSAADYLYTPGANGNWDFNGMKLRTSDYLNYEGFVAITNGSFKMTDSPDWGHGNYGYGGKEGKLVSGGDSKDIPVSPAGLYYVTANIPNLTYSATLITSVGLVGDATTAEWTPANAIELTLDLNTKTATATTTLKTGSVKFIFNKDWAINLGGDVNNLVQSGENLSVLAGTYKITLDLSTLPYTATFVAQ